MRYTWFASLVLLSSLSASPAQGQLAADISAPVRFNTNAGTDSGDDSNVVQATDGSGRWVAVWNSTDTLGGTIGTEFDILVSRSADNGTTWTAPQALNTNAATDSGWDLYAAIATDQAGHWVVVWQSDDSLGGSIGTDPDILVSRSTDNGATWTAPQVLNAYAATDSGFDYEPAIATDGAGNWIVVWSSTDTLGGTIGSDRDILVSRSTNNGATWTSFQPLNSNAATDSGWDEAVAIATDGAGHWTVVWRTRDSLGGTIGTDGDILVARSVDNGVAWTAPEPLNTNAATDTGGDFLPAIAVDDEGHQIVIWYSDDTLGGKIGTDFDILMSRSSDNGATWTCVRPLNTNAATDVGWDWFQTVLTDGSGQWIAVWRSDDDLGGGIGRDNDILVSRSLDNGASWTAPEPLNTTAATDGGDSDFNADLATDGKGLWSAVWTSTNTLGGTIGPDSDLLTARLNFCPRVARDEVYGRLVFDVQCAQDATGLPGGPGSPHVFDSKTIGFNRRPSDRVYLSRSAYNFVSLVVDDEIHVNGQDSGLGPYGYQNGVPPFKFAVPIEANLAPEPPPEVTSLIPLGASQVLIEAVDTQRGAYGNSLVYLVVDCGIWVGKCPAGTTTIDFVSHAVDVGGQPNDLYVVSGFLSELRQDQDFSRADCLGFFLDTTHATDERPDPPGGEGYYYLARGTCSDPTYGYSTLTPDPRDSLNNVDPCP